MIFATFLFEKKGENYLEEVKLSEDQVYDVIEFAQSLYGIDKFGIYTPNILNNELINLNNNPLIPSYEKIKQALSDYKNSAKDLQGYSEFMSVWDELFDRIVRYYSNILSFDLQITCKNALPEDYSSKEYLEDQRRIYKFLDKFDYKAEFRKVLTEILKRETFFCWFRYNPNDESDMNYSLQILPQKRCKLTGYWSNGMLFDFDMSYFLNPSISLDQYPPVFKKYYKETFDNKNGEKYSPANPLYNRDGTFAMWHQTSPFDCAWVFKMNPENFNQVPFLAPYLKTAIKNEEIAKLQLDKDIASAYGLLIGEMRMFDNAKSGTQKNQFSIDGKTLGQFLQLVQKGLKRNIKVGAMPTENTSFYQYNDTNPTMANQAYKEHSSLGASASRLIYSSDKMSNAEIENAIITDYGIMRNIYSQFNNFMNFFANQKTRKFKFNFSFEGTSYPFERKQRQEGIMKMAEVGLVLNSSAFSSAFGYRPNDFDRMLDEAHYGNFLNKLSSLISIHTASGVKGTSGRPEKDSGELTDSGERNREYGSTS